MSVQLFVPTFEIEECVAQFRECLEKGWTGLGFKTVEFEQAWLKYTGLSHAHFLSSNTVGLHLALYLFKTKMGWRDGDEIITTPLTFVSTNHAILYCQLKPIFADVDEYLCLNPEDIERKITPRTRAVMFVGISGNSGQLKRVAELCRRKGLTFVLDAAHMAGTRVDGQHVGSEADCAIFSFHAVKNLPTADSGMICFKDADDDARARKLTWLGINKDTYTRTTSSGAYKWMYDVEEVGFKYHGNSIMAGIGLVQLKYLDRDNAYRRQLASWYRAGFIDHPKVQVVPTAPDCESATHFLQIRVANRDELILALHEHQIYPGVHYRDNTEYQMYATAAGTCPMAAEASTQILSLPVHMRLTREDVRLVCKLVVRYAQ
jgi:dTDP-4-amino-4,6-dideoxygalactose transaminase